MRRLLTLFLLIFVFYSCTPSIVKKDKTDVAAHRTFPALYVIKEQVNLRDAPTTQSKKITILEDGDELRVHRNTNGWYQVVTDEGTQGWLRSDLAGPRSLSLTRMAFAFTDSVLPAFNAEMFFDKTELYKTVYLTLDPSLYISQEKTRSQAKKIGTAYQQKVYRGATEIRVMHPDSKELFLRFNLPAKGLAKIPVSVLDYGRLFSLQEKDKAVTVLVAVPDSISDKNLLKAARKISAKYDYPFNKAEIYMVSDSPAGMIYLKTFDEKPAQTNVCRLYYLEDADGEDYRFRFCDK